MSLPKTINSLVLNDLFVYIVDISIFNGVCYYVIVCIKYLVSRLCVQHCIYFVMVFIYKLCRHHWQKLCALQ